MTKSDRNKKLWLVATLLYSICLASYTMSYFITEPWHVIVGLGGDCIKNTFTYLYHSMYGHGYWFEGMNYPYGEHIVFTDGIPFLSVSFATLHHVSAQTALTVMWWFIALSYVLAIMYIYLTLLHFSVRPWIAMLFAGVIGIFSPQLMRFMGHYALSFSCIIPMLFYWTAKYNSRLSVKYPIYIFALSMFCNALHPYFQALILIWCLFYAAGYFIFEKTSMREKIAHLLPIITSPLLALGIFAIIMKFTDPVTDRPVQPYGMFDCLTRFEDIISSGHSPIWDFIFHRKLIKEYGGWGEGYAYIGIVSLMVLIVSLLLGFYKVITKKKQDFVVSKLQFSPVWIFMALGILFVGMGVPFIFKMEWLLKYLSAFRQIRAPGRFSWIFYYIISVYVVVIINTWYSRFVRSGKKKAGILMIFSLISVWFVEVSGYTSFIRQVADNSRHEYQQVFPTMGKNWKNWLGEQHYDKEDFQAIIALKMVQIGSEKFWVGDDDNASWGLTNSFIASLQLHLPIVDACMSRSSWGETRKQLKLSAGPYVQKPLLYDSESDKPYLLIHYLFHNNSDSMLEDDKYLLKAADYIGDFNSCNVYAFYPKRQRENDMKNMDSIHKIVQFMVADDTCIGEKNNVYIDHFNNYHSQQTIFGTGGMSCTGNKEMVIASIPEMPNGENQLYEYSNWFLQDSTTYASSAVNLSFLDDKGNHLGDIDVLTKRSFENEGLWSRGAMYFRMPKGCSRVVSRILDTGPDAYLALDEIMLRPANSLVISKSKNGVIMVNNHLFDPK